MEKKKKIRCKLKQISIHFGVSNNQISLYFGVPDGQCIVFNRQFSGTLKWSKIYLLGTSKWNRLSGTQKRSEIWSSGTPKWSKISILKKRQLDSNLYWTYGENIENCAHRCHRQYCIPLKQEQRKAYKASLHLRSSSPRVRQ